jgi:fumarate reductase (CoM/CoB) subunit A
MNDVNIVKGDYDVIIIGSGVAGLRAGVEVVKSKKKILMITNGKPCMDIVGFNVPIPECGDSPAAFLSDILSNGKYINNIRLAALLANRAEEELRHLEGLGLSFIHDGKKYLPRLTSGNSYPRTLYRKDRTGPDILKTLFKCYRQRGGEEIRDELVLKIFTRDNHVTGILTCSMEGVNFRIYRAGSVIIATGGLGPLYEKSSNATSINGDGFVMALEAGAELVDMEFVQFEPFMMILPDSDDIFTVSFLLHDDPNIYNSGKQNILPENWKRINKGELSRILFRQIMKGNTSGHGGLYFDCTRFTEKQLQNHQKFLDVCKRNRIDPRKSPLEITPVQHNFLGGIRIDSSGMTSVNGLYAAGEAAGGIHGADRLAGNSGTDGLVFGAIAGLSAAQKNKYEKVKQSEGLFDEANREIEQFKKYYGPLQEWRNTIASLLWNNVGIIRNKYKLSETLNELIDMDNKLTPTDNTSAFSPITAFRNRNTILLAKLITKAALLRSESRGVHFREDCEGQDDLNWIKNIVFRKRGDLIQYNFFLQRQVPESNIWNGI